MSKPKSIESKYEYTVQSFNNINVRKQGQLISNFIDKYTNAGYDLFIFDRIDFKSATLIFRRLRLQK